MNSSQKTSSKISGFFKKLFASLKLKKRREVFFVLLAVLVLGFSVKVSFAKISGDPPKPGTPLTQLSPEWQTAIANPSIWMQAFDRYTINQIKNSGVVPTDTNMYISFLKGMGGYSKDEAFQAATTYKNNLTQDTPGSNTNQSYVNTGTTPTVAGQLAGAAGEAFATVVLKVVIGVLAILAFFCKYLLMFAGWTLDATLNPGLYNFTNNKMIVDGWIIVRDVCNLFFLLVLIFISICTILKIEKYHAKKTLLTLIIMALLINFSKPIAIFIFDGSQLLMSFFLSKMGPEPSTKFVGQIAILIYDNLMKQIGTQESLQIAIYYLFVVVFLFMFAVAMFVTAIFLVIRIVAVMILIIVSPLAFFAAIIPDFSKMSSSWWSALFKYCYYGPAAAFFLYLATNFALGNVLPKLNAPNQGMIMVTLIQYFTVLVFLYASIIMSQQFGVFAAGAIVGNANRFMKWAGKGAALAPYRATAWGARSSGISGAVSQRLQQSRYGRLLTKEGRKEAQEDNEAKMAERFGVKGAMERQIQKKAKKYKDEHYTEEALKAMAAKGDAAAAFLLSENGDMDNATYAALQSKGSYKGNVKKMVDKKLKKKQMHIFVDGQLDNFISEKVTAGTTYATRDLARHVFAKQEFGKLTPDDWKEQDWTTVSGDSLLRSAARTVYAGMNPRNQQKVTDSITGAKYAAGKIKRDPVTGAIIKPGIWL